MGETVERRLRNSGKDPQPPTRADPAAAAAAARGKGAAGDMEDEAHETMPCAPGRISSNSRQPGQRGGSLLSKRYFDPKTHKVYPGAPALFRNTEQRGIFVTLVTLPWKCLVPLPPCSLESEAYVKDGALESSSQPLDRPVNCISRKKRKKKGKHHKKSMAKTVSTVLATQCEESISDSSVCETSLSTDTVSISELNLENSMPENSSSCSLAVHHIMAEQYQSQMCRPYSISQRRDTFGSDFQNDVAMPTENAISYQPGPCETQVIVEEDITSEGAPSTVTDTSEVSLITVTDTSDGTPSTLFNTSEGTPSIVTDTVKQISPSELKDMIQDLCLADSEDHKCMKAESENSHEDNDLDNASLPEEKKDSLTPDIGGTGSSAAVVDESIPTSLKSKNEDELPISSSHDISAASNSCLMHKVKDQCFSGFETDLGKIVQVVDDSYRLQTISEGVRLVTGSPVAEFEKFVLSATPVLEKLSCRTCSPNQFIGDSFCGHPIPNIPLRSLWQWYEKLGSYGMEVKAMDYNGSHKSCNGGFGFRTYFVPYLSAIQLFGRCRSSAGSNSYSNKEVREGGASDEGSTQWCRSTHQDDGELLFEYFESVLPHQRRPLHEKYSVAWYLLYRIPDGNFRATFLIYYSLGNFVRVTSERPGSSGRLVSLVVGLQTYNAKGECWFRPTVSKTKECQTDLSPDPSEIMEGRIRMQGKQFARGMRYQ